MYLGADPELFIQREGKIIPASAVGLKDGKHILKNRLNLCSELQIYRDGYAAEVNFTRPFTCRGVMGSVLREGLARYLDDQGEDFSFSSIPATPVELKALRKLPSDVAAFGCSPSFNAWEDGATSFMEVDGLSHPWRYAGGHLWFSEVKGDQWWTDHILESVKLLDLHVGVPFSWLFSRPEQFQRRSLYGRAGEFRTKDFEEGSWQGLEYRTLGPEWLNHAAFFSLAFGSARMTLLQAEGLWATYKDFLEGEGKEVVPAAINTGEYLDDLMKDLTFEPFFGKGTLKRLRDDSALGDDRFKFNLFDVGDFHHGWFFNMKELGIIAEEPTAY